MKRSTPKAGERDAHIQKHLPSRLMRESLMDKQVLAGTETPTYPMLPDANVVAIGGSIIDRGRDALMPLLDEIVRCRRKHKLILGVGGGARLRHVYHIGLDLGLPIGALAMIAGAVNEQNRYMVQGVLAQHGGVVLHKDHFVVLPLWLAAGMIPILSGMPPYHQWEPPAGAHRLPRHGNDFGLFMVAETLGARSIIFVKDEQGLYTADPKKDPSALHIPAIAARALLDRRLVDLCIDLPVVESLLHARLARRVQIINGLEPKQLRQALAGEPVGTVITGEPNDEDRELHAKARGGQRNVKRRRNGQ